MNTPSHNPHLHLYHYNIKNYSTDTEPMLPDDKRPKLLNANSYATLPGELTLCPKKFKSYYGFNPHTLINKLIKPFSKTARNKDLFYRIIAEKLQFGCINPAIIWNKKRQLVAISTNLSTNDAFADYHVIKIYKEQLIRLGNFNQLENGDRLATVATYSTKQQQGIQEHWDDVHPIVLECLSASEVTCQQKFNEIDKESWEHLETGIKSLSKNSDIGLYPFSID